MKTVKHISIAKPFTVIKQSSLLRVNNEVVCYCYLWRGISSLTHSKVKRSVSFTKLAYIILVYLCGVFVLRQPTCFYGTWCRYSLLDKWYWKRLDGRGVCPLWKLCQGTTRSTADLGILWTFWLQKNMRISYQELNFPFRYCNVFFCKSDIHYVIRVPW